METLSERTVKAELELHNIQKQINSTENVAPGRGEPNRTFASVKKLNLHTLFQNTDRIAERGLGDMRLAGRGREIAGFRNKSKVLQLVEIKHQTLLCRRAQGL